jgi:hypothetical protein
MSPAPSPDEVSLSQLTASTRQSFFLLLISAAVERIQIIGHHEGTSTTKLIIPFQVHPGLRVLIWKRYHYFEENMTGHGQPPRKDLCVPLVLIYYDRYELQVVGLVVFQDYLIR